MKVSGVMPDVTLAQATSIVGWVVAQAVAYGWLDTRYSQVAVSAGATLLVVAWHFADALIRNGRAKAVAANPALINLTTTVKK
jgi:hypothetical protein